MPETLKPPYLRKGGRRGDLQVWIVDGSFIRTQMDVEFTNFGQHFRYKYIPENELWLDQEANNDERTFFIDHLLVERELMSQGVPYEKALEEANLAERRERRRAGDMAKMTKRGKELPDANSVHERLWKKLENGVSVWIVTGRLIRSVFNIDFTAGGHDHVYEFVPEGEVWIDNDVVEKERGYVLVHELHERNCMSKGMTYSQAHEESSQLEYHCRRHPDELHDALYAEGWA